MGENKLKNRIMRRVYGIWFVRRALPMAGGSALFMDIALKETARRFFVAKIFSNFLAVASSNAWAIPGFIESAAAHAEPSLLVLIGASGLLGFTLAVKLWRSVKNIAISSRLAAAYAAENK